MAKELIALGLLAYSASALANTYFLVSPLRSSGSTQGATVHLSPLALTTYKSINGAFTLDLNDLVEVHNAQVADVTYSATLPEGLTLDPLGRITGTPIKSGINVLTVQAKLPSGSISTQAYQVQVSHPQSCYQVYYDEQKVTTGWYRLDVDGDRAEANSKEYFCSGGWTRVAYQKEEAPVAWTGEDNGVSYTIPDNLIPQHTYTAFSANNTPGVVDYVAFNYHTGAIPITTVTGYNTGHTYHILRDPAAVYWGNDPEGTRYTDAPEQFNALTFDRVGGSYFTWSFLPFESRREVRGYGLLGNYAQSSDSGSWEVWVR